MLGTWRNCPTGFGQGISSCYSRLSFDPSLGITNVECKLQLVFNYLKVLESVSLYQLSYPLHLIFYSINPLGEVFCSNASSVNFSLHLLVLWKWFLFMYCCGRRMLCTVSWTQSWILVASLKNQLLASFSNSAFIDATWVS